MGYPERIAKLTDWMRGEAIEAILLVDEEGRRDPSIRYLTGHPSDALLFVRSDGHTLLIPWDAILAGRLATADEIIPYSEHERSLPAAFEKSIERLDVSGKIELADSTPYPVYSELSARYRSGEIVCREAGVSKALLAQRAVKDGEEIAKIREAARMTNEILGLLDERLARSQRGDATEVDIALYVEQEARSRGAEAMAFESLVAGPTRSWGIHAFPPYGGGPFGGPGMSILDFGVVIDGYPSDVTLTVARGRLTKRQEEMIDLVEQAYELAALRARPGVECFEVAQAVNELFGSKGYSMPHSLGHGIGLQVHEAPYLRARRESSMALASGMVFTIEPGLYDAEAGGVRWENDFLVTASGSEVLTSSRILRFP